MWRFRRGWTSGSILSGAVVTGRECGRRLLIHFPDSKLRRKLMTGKTRALGVGIVAIFICICAICGVVAGGAKAQSGGAPRSTNAPGPKKAEEQFKNIQVLKGVPADQLFPTMQFITASLGVECEFCHVQNAFEKDDKKPKQTARKMMEMMFAINKDNFEGHREVTCYSCHRGSADPQAIPAVMTEEPKEAQPKEAMGGPKPAEAKESTGPAAEQLLDKYVQAAGGAAAIDKVTSRVMKG